MGVTGQKSRRAEVAEVAEVVFPGVWGGQKSRGAEVAEVLLFRSRWGSEGQKDRSSRSCVLRGLGC